MTNYVVTAPLVIVRQKDGSRVHVYAGAPVPKDADREHLEQLIDQDMVEKAAEPESDEDGAPAKSAAKAEWEAYARAQGATDEDLEGKTKDELVSTYGA